MIAVNVNAGLANQMFHYAFGRGLINKGYDVFFDQINLDIEKNGFLKILNFKMHFLI